MNVKVGSNEINITVSDMPSLRPQGERIDGPFLLPNGNIVYYYDREIPQGMKSTGDHACYKNMTSGETDCFPTFYNEKGEICSTFWPVTFTHPDTRKPETHYQCWPKEDFEEIELIDREKIEVEL